MKIFMRHARLPRPATTTSVFSGTKGKYTPVFALQRDRKHATLHDVGVDHAVSAGFLVRSRAKFQGDEFLRPRRIPSGT